MKKSKLWETYIYIGLNNYLNTASELGADTPAHAPVYSGEYLHDGGHQVDLDAIGGSINMSLKFAPDQIAHQLKIWARFGRFMAKKRTF